MEEEGNSADPATGQSERREDSRLAVDEEAGLLLLNSGSRLDCRIVEISLTGCRMSLRDRFAGGVPARVEASFELCGFCFRFCGLIEWTDGKHLAGVRFAEMTPRRRDELVQALCEVAAAEAVRTIKKAAERLSTEEGAQKRLEGAQSRPVAPLSPAIPPAEVSKGMPSFPGLPEFAAERRAPPKPISAPVNSARLAAQACPQPQPPAQSPHQPAAKLAGRERRTQSRHEVNTSATILLVNVASRIQGRILNLSLGGCSIRTEERFPVGIYTRVETEFHLEGLPFRLGGVVQAIKERQHIGIRFLDMSGRKKEQVEQLIAEIEESRQLESPAAAPGRGDKSLPA